MIYLKYFLYLLKHKYYFWEGSKIYEVGLWAVICHDLDKFLLDRFPSFAKRYAGIMNEVEHTMAVHKHHHSSKHHVEWWVFHTIIGTNTQYINIPDKYLREFITDWYAAGKSRYNNSPIEFYEKYKNNFLINVNTQERLERILYGK